MEDHIPTILLTCQILVALVVLFGAAGIVLIVLLHRNAMKSLHAKLDAVTTKVGESLDAGVKLLEVKNFYEETHADYQRMLNQAHRDADRSTQDRIRRLIDRLNTLKARTLDSTSQLLSPEGSKPRRKRRRRPRRSSRSRSKKSQGDKGGDSKKNQRDTSGSKG